MQECALGETGGCSHRLCKNCACKMFSIKYCSRSMAPPACESDSQEVEESDARGSKQGGPGGQISPPGGPISRPGGGPKTSFWRPPGASWVPGRPQERSRREKGSWKIRWRALGSVLGPSWRVLSPLRIDFLSQGGAREGSPRSFLKVFWDVRAERPKKSI